MTQQNIASNWNIIHKSTLTHAAFARRASTEFTAPSTDFNKTEFTYNRVYLDRLYFDRVYLHPAYNIHLRRNVPPYVCLYLCQILVNFQNSFLVTFHGQIAIKRR